VKKSLTPNPSPKGEGSEKTIRVTTPSLKGRDGEGLGLGLFT